MLHILTCDFVALRRHDVHWCKLESQDLPMLSPS